MLEVADLQPLAGEIFDQRRRLFVLQHSAHLRVEILAQRAALRVREELVIRHRAPEKIREPRGERPFVDRVRRFRIVRLRLELAAEKEVRRNENRGQRGLHALLEVAALLPRLLVNPHEPLHLLRRERPPKGACAERGKNRARRIFEVRLAAARRENAHLGRRRDDRLRRARSVPVCGW